MNKSLTIGDYKKWLLYSFDNQNFETHYNLLKALKAGDSFKTVTVTVAGNTYTLSAEGISDSLEITDDQRQAFIKYLIDYYFQTDDVDSAMLEKSQAGERAVNHGYVASGARGHAPDEKYVVRQHPKESIYYNIRLTISALFYLAVGGILAYTFITDIGGSLLLLMIGVPFVLVVLLTARVLHGIFIGMIRGNSIRVTKDQFPEVYSIIEAQAKAINTTIPEIYITSGHFNAFVTKFSRAHILMIYSEVIETTLKGNYDVLKYVTAHELCHIKRKHLTIEKYLLPSKIVPFLSLAHSRGCEYTCDRAGYDFSPQGSIEGILIMTTGKEIHSKFNVEKHIKHSLENEGFWTWLSEKFLTHPHLYKRLAEIKEYSIGK
ncbi:M48 family metallopeptidase [Fulvivirgaceae bacterium PWU4]|uniref:M48 family metallopeptidase n=1 Tax=Chryseosolibacter histidini TaxID=2782349 RepID=A0AAP2GJA6_9BACT|nr:M48 family metallopeptidase [Chryseosolibacter histidini]MBT1698136.1 M48 family metallopeptidase [Chryseosolibacter histidini]